MVSMFDADSKKELMSHNVSDLYQDPSKRNLFVKKLMKNGFVKNEELNLVTLTGKKIIASVSAVMKKDKNGNVYFDGIVENITSRKKTEEALKKSYNTLEIKVEKRTRELKKHVIELENIRKAMVNVFEDLNTEKTKAESLANDLRKFKLALDNVSDHVTITDKEGIVVYANEAVEKITGYSTKETGGIGKGYYKRKRN
jgi:PAS domain-containing protein